MVAPPPKKYPLFPKRPTRGKALCDTRVRACPPSPFFEKGVIANMEMEEFEKRRKCEKARLTRIYCKEAGERRLSAERKAKLEGLIDRAAFLLVTIEDLERDIEENGYTEMFSQGDQKPYTRKRPAADILNSYNTTYLKCIKQIEDMIPKATGKTEKDDGFNDFINGRDEI